MSAEKFYVAKTLDQIENALFDAWNNTIVLRNPHRESYMVFSPKWPRIHVDNKFSDGESDVWSVLLKMAAEMPTRRLFTIEQRPFWEYGRELREVGHIIATEIEVGRVEITIRLRDAEEEVAAALDRWRSALGVALSVKHMPDANPNFPNLETMLKAVRGWPAARAAGQSRWEYVADYHISESTLTRWRNKLRRLGYDVPDRF